MTSIRKPVLAAEYQGRRLRESTAAGRRAAYEHGRVPRPPAFGYECTVRPGCHRPATEASVIVIEIFMRVVMGEAPSAISKDLTRRFPAWSGRFRSGDTIRRIVRSPLYKGLVVSAKSLIERDALTGRPVRRALPEGSWMVVFVPDLRIVADELWSLANKMINVSGRASLAVG